MSDDIAISVKNVSKAYRIWRDPSARLKAPLIEAWQKLRARSYELIAKASGQSAPSSKLQAPSSSPYYKDFYALKDVSFEVKKGEAVGIIGRNGSGKSTLLQMIAGTLTPTSGSIQVNGRVAALLELGSGFNPDFTGRENVYLNASVLGLTREEIDVRYNEITAFADIGDFINQPVKTYSSGMLMRLAFSVQVAVNPDVLIVDEALSVGDVFFTQKCFSKIRKIQEKGTTLLLVSHDTAAIQNLCDHGILLNQGQLLFVGPPEEATSRYHALQSGDPIQTGNKKGGDYLTAPLLTPELVNWFRENNILKSARSRQCGEVAEIASAVFQNEFNAHAYTVKQGAVITITLKIKAIKDIQSPHIGFHIYDRMNNLVFAAGSPQLGIEPTPLLKGQSASVAIKVTLTIQPGPYTFNLSCGEISKENPNIAIPHDRHDGLGPITVWQENDKIHPFYGIAQLPMEITYHQSA
jgi:lipopolysaccharide transport system ATP-binding protein